MQPSKKKSSSRIAGIKAIAVEKSKHQVVREL